MTQAGSPALDPSDPRWSHATSLWGLDERTRQHYIPGNRRRGLGVREKRGFPTEAAALEFIEGRGMRPGQVYQCAVCSEWHVARPPRDGDDNENEARGETT